MADYVTREEVTPETLVVAERLARRWWENSGLGETPDPVPFDTLSEDDQGNWCAVAVELLDMYREAADLVETVVFGDEE